MQTFGFLFPSVFIMMNNCHNINAYQKITEIIDTYTLNLEGIIQYPHCLTLPHLPQHSQNECYSNPCCMCKHLYKEDCFCDKNICWLSISFTATVSNAFQQSLRKKQRIPPFNIQFPSFHFPRVPNRTFNASMWLHDIFPYCCLIVDILCIYAFAKHLQYVEVSDSLFNSKAF